MIIVLKNQETVLPKFFRFPGNQSELQKTSNQEEIHLKFTCSIMKAADYKPIFRRRTADFLSGSNRVKICRGISLRHTNRFFSSNHENLH